VKNVNLKVRKCFLCENMPFSHSTQLVNCTSFGVQPHVHSPFLQTPPLLPTTCPPNSSPLPDLPHQPYISTISPDSPRSPLSTQVVFMYTLFFFIVSLRALTLFFCVPFLPHLSACSIGGAFEIGLNGACQKLSPYLNEEYFEVSLADRMPIA